MEIQIIKAIQSLSCPFLDFIFKLITMLGEELFILVGIGAVYWSIDKKAGRYLSYALFSTMAINNLVKDFFKMTRPIGIPDIKSSYTATATGYSFPSGHAQISSTFFTAKARLAQKRIYYLAAIAISSLVAVSRLYWGVHYPKDVIVGMALGIIIAFLCKAVLERYDNEKKVYLVTMLGLLPTVFFGTTPDFTKSYGSFAGFVAAMYFEDRFVKFTTEITKIKKWLRVIVGMALLFAMRSSLRLIMPKYIIFDSIQYFLISFIGLGVYPLLFKKLRF